MVHLALATLNFIHQDLKPISKSRHEISSIIVVMIKKNGMHICLAPAVEIPEPAPMIFGAVSREDIDANRQAWRAVVSLELQEVIAAEGLSRSGPGVGI
jgi:hypothetical protein